MPAETETAEIAKMRRIYWGGTALIILVLIAVAAIFVHAKPSVTIISMMNTSKCYNNPTWYTVCNDIYPKVINTTSNTVTNNTILPPPHLPPPNFTVTTNISLPFPFNDFPQYNVSANGFDCTAPTSLTPQQIAYENEWLILYLNCTITTNETNAPNVTVLNVSEVTGTINYNAEFALPNPVQEMGKPLYLFIPIMTNNATEVAYIETYAPIALQQPYVYSLYNEQGTLGRGFQDYTTFVGQMEYADLGKVLLAENSSLALYEEDYNISGGANENIEGT